MNTMLPLNRGLAAWEADGNTTAITIAAAASLSDLRRAIEVMSTSAPALIAVTSLAG
jgi:hypothetical protein